MGSLSGTPAQIDPSTLQGINNGSDLARQMQWNGSDPSANPGMGPYPGTTGPIPPVKPGAPQTPQAMEQATQMAQTPMQNPDIKSKLAQLFAGLMRGQPARHNVPLPPWQPR